MIGIKKIDVKYVHPFHDCLRFVMEWENEEGIIISGIVPNERRFDIDWEDNGYLKETDYFSDGPCEVIPESGCDGICIPLPGNNDYGDHSVTIEFTDGTKITYDLPEQGNNMLHDLMDYVESRYKVTPGHSELATAARLLDDDMAYEI